MRELVRVTRRGGTVVLAVIGYLAVLRTILLRAPDDLAKPLREEVSTRGDHHYTGGFCDSHFFRPEELQGLAESAGLQTLETRACEGLSSNLPEATNALRRQPQRPLGPLAPLGRRNRPRTGGHRHLRTLRLRRPQPITNVRFRRRTADSILGLRLRKSGHASMLLHMCISKNTGHGHSISIPHATKRVAAGRREAALQGAE